MTKQDILRLIEQDEGSRVEFKKRFGDNTLKTISAFANTDGGFVLIGVDDKKQIIGIDLTDAEYQRISNRIIDKLGIMPELELIDVEDKKVLLIKVKKSFIPISFDGRYYKRVGNTTREMTFDELKRFFQRDLRWERLADKDFSFDEIDEPTVRKFLRAAADKGRLTVFSGSEPLEEIFEKLGLLENGKINNAGMLLFGKNPQKYFDFAKVRIVRLKDNITIIGDRWIDGNLFNQIERTEEAIKSFINVRYEINGLERKDIWDYPLEAIREAVANAILHRDYLKPVSVQIKIFDDRIWFYNVGGLPENWDLEKLLNIHPSIPRNPTIFNIFYLAGIVESVGSGIERMTKYLEKQNLPAPRIDASNSEFSMFFYKDLYTEEYLRKLGLNDRQIKAVLYVKEHGKITNREYIELNNVSRITATRDLAELVEIKILKQQGEGKRELNYVLYEAKKM